MFDPVFCPLVEFSLETRPDFAERRSVISGPLSFFGLISEPTDEVEEVHGDGEHAHQEHDVRQNQEGNRIYIQGGADEPQADEHGYARSVRVLQMASIETIEVVEADGSDHGPTHYRVQAFETDPADPDSSRDQHEGTDHVQDTRPRLERGYPLRDAFDRHRREQPDRHSRRGDMLPTPINIKFLI
ncbi:MAG: hypothetical protein ABEK02_01360 [Haloquadratum sp.]